MQQPTLSPRPVYHRVDSLRILGCSMVAAYHFCTLSLHGVSLLPDNPWPQIDALQNAIPPIARVLMAGHAALIVFFVVSGFVLRLSLSHGPQTVGAASARFVLGRAFRIFPIVFFAVAMTALSTNGIVGYPDSHPLTATEYIANGLLLSCSVNSNYWALQLEMVMIPFILALYFTERRFGPWCVLAIAVVGSALCFVGRWLYWPPLSVNFFAFALGMALPTLGRQWVTSMSQRSAAFWTLGAVIVLFSTRTCFGLYTRYSTFCEGYAGAILVAMAAYRTDLRGLSFLDSKLLSRTGLAAGSYYVLHTATFGVTLMIAAWLVPVSWSQNVPAVVGVLVVGGWLVALAPISMLSYRLVEAPGVALGKKVLARLGLDSRPKETQPPQRLAA